MTEVNKLPGVVVGEYGNTITLTIVDADNVAVDISSYSTSKIVTLRSPDHLKVVTATGSFSGSGGTDGVITFSPATGDIDRAGTWVGQVKLEGATKLAFSEVFTIEVEKRISASS